MALVAFVWRRARAATAACPAWACEATEAAICARWASLLAVLKARTAASKAVIALAVASVVVVVVADGVVVVAAVVVVAVVVGGGAVRGAAGGGSGTLVRTVLERVESA